MRNTATAVVAIVLITLPLSMARAADRVKADLKVRLFEVAAQTDITGRELPGGERDHRPHIQVRVYNAGVVQAADQAVALRAATSILAAAGIGVTWLYCGDGVTDAIQMTCDTPLVPLELSVRFVRLPASPSPRGELPLGYSLVDTAAGAGKLATIFVDRVRWLAGQAGVDTPMLVGFAVAHEIGHLLLGTNAHGSSGLMRAVWSRAELRRGDAADWLFGRSEAARMQSSLLQREGLISSQPEFHATGCPVPVDDAAASATGTADCSRNAVAAVRGVAARPYR